MEERGSGPAPVRVGRYALCDEIASGGMASVHFGRLLGHAGFSRIVAIKRLLPHVARDPDFVSMFVDEARLAARIRHPNVVPIVDVEAVAGELLLVMEYVHGETLSRLLRTARKRGERVPLPIVATIFSNILHGLHAAHEAHDTHGRPLGIVHRDVSPQNLLVGADGVARVVDFGVAKAAHRLQTTRDGQLKGKLAYMAPEQITATGDRRMDVYAASVVLWETLTGERLFDGENDGAIMHQVLNMAVPAPSARVADLPSAWDEIVLRGLARVITVRFPTARAMALAIEQGATMARPSEVGEWVAGCAHEALARRTAQMARLDRTSDSRISTRVSAPTRVERRRETPQGDSPGDANGAPNRAVDSDGAPPPRMSWLQRVSEQPIATTLRSPGGRAATGGALAATLVLVLVLASRSRSPASVASGAAERGVGAATVATATPAATGTATATAASSGSSAPDTPAPPSAAPQANVPPPDPAPNEKAVERPTPSLRRPTEATAAAAPAQAAPRTAGATPRATRDASKKQVSLGTLLDSPN
jgi:serine/threonine-protein kinase